ncbi:hypothetical protein K491DRAFT_694899 [Lophiostoma macrostomum CBS 122681]|uniref:Adipose-regulatory protein-domain-containing protein n=1 Tax=Lophiostoma macrostomum CBS 122681 TaxID=1314788 RepID=A0A6A6SZT0_9PLEO|nr:hypothetical protein K491DRAFT_694899 [Lophiostoma macrostomum CBS 122681]
MDDVEDDYESEGGIVGRVKAILLAPLRILLSPTLLRTYLRTLLILVTSSILFGAAVIAYSAFYYKFIPVKGVEVPVYLQYSSSSSSSDAVRVPASSQPPWDNAQAAANAGAGAGAKAGVLHPHPHGIANIHGLTSRQKYDVTVQIVLPRSEKNLGIGNWMVGLEMRGPVTMGGGVKSLLGWGEEWDVDDFSAGGEGAVRRGRESVGGDSDGFGFATGTGSGTGSGTGAGAGAGAGAAAGHIKDNLQSSSHSSSTQKPLTLARSLRPAILTYRSPAVSLAYRLLRLPLYVLDLHTESETIDIRMMEGVEFDKGWRNVPSSLKLEIRARAPLDVYRVTVRFAARLEGLRWVMHNHRVISAVLFTSLFWGVEMGVLLGTWGVAVLLFSGSGSGRAIKDEGVDEDGHRERKKIKKEASASASGTITPKLEPDDERDSDDEPETPLSDTSHTFPTLSSQRPLHYSSATSLSDHAQASPEAAAFVQRVKRERGGTPGLEDVPSARTEAEADDEDEEEGYRDSGIGTSVESAREGLGLARRRSQRGFKDG